MPLERLTCLVLPGGRRPERRRARVSRSRRRSRARSASSASTVHAWGETDDPYALVASLLPGRGRAALDNHMWAEKVLRLRAAMPARRPAARRHGAARAADAQDARRGRGAAPRRCGDRPGARAGAASGCAPAAPSARSARTSPTRSSPRATCASTSSSSASGPNGASPHHELSDRVIEQGDPVVVDIGGTMPDGYCSDETRTYSVGEPPAEFAAYYEVLLRGAARRVRARATRRDRRERRRRGPRRHHRRRGTASSSCTAPGHGIGLETHEEPYIVSGNTELLEPGMAFSIEPGIYLPGPARRAHRGHRGVRRDRRRARQPAPARAGRALMALSVTPDVADAARPRSRSSCCDLVREIADAELAPRVAAAEHDGTFFRDELRTLGRAGLLSLPYAEAVGAGSAAVRGLPAGARGARRRVAVGRHLGLGAHARLLPGRRRTAPTSSGERWLPEMLGGELLGAYCLSEPQSGSDAAALHDPGGARRRRLRRDRHQGVDHPRRRGRLLQPHGAHLRRRRRGASRCLLADASTTRGCRARRPSARWARRRRAPRRCCSTARASPVDRLIGAEGQGFKIALAALDAGRLGIAACAVGLAQAALDAADGVREGAAAVRARRSASSRACSSCSPTWPRRCRPSRALVPRGRAPQGPRAAVLASRRRRPSCSPPTPRCASPPTPCRCSAATATSRTSRSSATCARPRCCRSSRAPTRSSAWSSAARSTSVTGRAAYRRRVAIRRRAAASRADRAR